MDIFRLANDSLGVFNTRNEKKHKSCSCHSVAGSKGETIDSAVFSQQVGLRVPSYKAGPAMPLPYSGTSLPQQSRFGRFAWNHEPLHFRSVFETDGPMRSRPANVLPEAVANQTFVTPLKPKPKASAWVVAKPVAPRRPASGPMPPQTPKPDLFAGLGKSQVHPVQTDWDGLWQS